MLKQSTYSPTDPGVQPEINPNPTYSLTNAGIDFVLYAFQVLT
jgi:hypothetical protein